MAIEFHRSLTALLCIGCMLLGSGSTRAEPPENGLMARPKDQYAVLARGFNLPNWDPEYSGFEPDDTLLTQLFNLGFTHIRLPIYGEGLMPEFSPPDAIETYLDALFSSVGRLQGLGFATSLDMHPGEKFGNLHKSNPAKGLTQLFLAWDNIVRRAHKWPADKTFLELLNEPVIPQDIWWRQAQELLDRIRINLPDHPVIVGPAVYQRYEPLLSSKPLNGENVIYAVHYYDPFVFTHQGMSWDEDSPSADIAFLPFPADLDHGAVQAQIADLRARGKFDAVKAIEDALEKPWNAARVANDFKAVSQWSLTHKVPVIVNEFGTLNHVVKVRDRTNWLRAVAQGAETNGIGWTHWAFSDGFGMIDSDMGTADEAVIEALLFPQESAGSQ